MSFTADDLQRARSRAVVPISRLRNSIPPELQEITDTFNSRYARFFNVVELVTPVNAREEKENFLASGISRAADPVFAYDKNKLAAAISVEAEVQSLYERVISIKAKNGDEDFYLSLLRHRLNDAIITVRVAKSIAESKDIATKVALLSKFDYQEGYWANEAHAEYSAIKNQAPVPCADAPHILGFLTPNERDFLETTTNDAPAIAEAFSQVAKFYGFRMNWQFPVSNTATACDVRSASFDYDTPAMVVPVTRKVSGMKLLELIGHEVEEHMRQEENGNILFAGLGHAMMKGDETHIEGIAKISDINFSALWQGEIISAPQPWYILAIDYVDSSDRGHGFADTARYIYELARDAGKTEKQAMTTAWNTVYRIKRGNTTNDPRYFMSKDAGYFIGYHMAREVESVGLGQYLEMGCFSTEWIMKIAKRYIVEPDDIPFRRLDAARRYFEHVMSANIS